MSQYLEFYVRHNNDYLPIASYCGSSAYMEMFDNYVPSYSGLRTVTESMLGSVRADVRQRIKENEQCIKRAEKLKQNILQANNSMEEKLDYIAGEDQAIEETEDENEALDGVDHFINFLYDILEEAEFGEHEGIQKDKYLYAGVEPAIHKDCDEMTPEEIEEARGW